VEGRRIFGVVFPIPKGRQLCIHFSVAFSRKANIGHSNNYGPNGRNRKKMGSHYIFCVHTCVTTKNFSKHQRDSREINANANSCVISEGSKYAQWIGLYLCFRLTWILGPFVYGRLQNLNTSKDAFGRDITPLSRGII